MLHAGLKSRLTKIEAKRNVVSRISGVLLRDSKTGDEWIDRYVPKGVVTGKVIVLPHFESEKAWEAAAIEQQTALLRVATSKHADETAESVGTRQATEAANELMGKLRMDKA